ncbi:hypothetical protein FQA39_LY15834 [Lamprigera yunnana]|nr:hypothetical protein FQA39_LY15834 [Lamprigera yunnana]
MSFRLVGKIFRLPENPVKVLDRLQCLPFSNKATDLEELKKSFWNSLLKADKKNELIVSETKHEISETKPDALELKPEVRWKPKIEEDHETLNSVEVVEGLDPMPPFTTVEQRMLDLNEKRLHPLYKRCKTLTRRPLVEPTQYKYRCNCDPIDFKDIPKHFGYNIERMQHTNKYSEFKKVELPRQLVAKIIEMQQNKRRTIEEVVDVKKEDLDPSMMKNQKIFDTLHQNTIK